LKSIFGEHRQRWIHQPATSRSVGWCPQFGRLSHNFVCRCGRELGCGSQRSLRRLTGLSLSLRSRISRAAAFVPWSIEVAGDAPTLVSEIGKLVNDGLLQLLNVALTSGSGTGMPTGILTALAGGSSVVATATADTITAADVYNVQSSLGPRWQPNARGQPTSAS